MKEFAAVIFNFGDSKSTVCMTPMNNSELQTLNRLRAGFLNGSAGDEDYWKSVEDIELYDKSFARRIGWKWLYVLGEAERLGWAPPAGTTIVDWGCGSGIASQTVIEHFGAGYFSRAQFYDRSKLAGKYAAERSREKFPSLFAEQSDMPDVAGATIVASHLITELNPSQIRALVERFTEARTIIWTEPGSYPASRALIYAREALRGSFNIVAPCLHAEKCGMTSPSNNRHWCHFFADPPPESFTERKWSQYADQLGIDLGDLPLSYLILDKRPFSNHFAPDAERIIARPGVSSSDAVVTACKSSGVREYIVKKSRLPDEWRSYKKGKFSSVRRWRAQGGEIVEIIRNDGDE